MNDEQWPPSDDGLSSAAKVQIATVNQHQRDAAAQEAHRVSQETPVSDAEEAQ